MRTVRTIAALAALSASGLATTATTAAAPEPNTAPTPGPAFSPADVIDLLAAGNDRFADGRPEHRNAGLDRLALTADSQHPFATVLACADSRLPVGRLFDRGVGDLYTIRVAGNLIGPDTAGSIEYAVESLGTPVIVVLGHTHCDAIRAAQDSTVTGAHSTRLFDALKPAIEKARAATPPGVDIQTAAVRANVFDQVERLISGSPSIAGAVEAGRLAITAAVYDIETGRVDWLGEHPQQTRLVADATDSGTRDATTSFTAAPPRTTTEPAPEAAPRSRFAMPPIGIARNPGDTRTSQTPRRRFVNVPTDE